MRFSRRKILHLTSAGVFLSAVMQASKPLFAAGREDFEPVKGGNGLYSQPWFHDSFLDLAEDIEEAQATNKQILILWEQDGCPYCKEMHTKVLTRPAIVAYLKQHYQVIQLDIRGSRELTDFSGTVMEERHFARQMQIHFTPTLSFLPKDPAKVKNQTGRAIEAFRLAGYWKPFHFESVLRFVREGHYKKDNLQHFIDERVKKLRARGQKVDIW